MPPSPRTPERPERTDARPGPRPGLGLLVPALLALACGGGSPPAPPPSPVPEGDPPPALEWLGAATIPPATVCGGTLVGGLSGLVWDPRDGSFYALSDDRGRLDPVRYYRLRIDLSEGRLAPGGVRCQGVTLLTDAAHRPYARAEIDPEGFALDARGTFYFASEGVAADAVAPFVAALRADGSEARRFPLPPRYTPDGDERRGVRDNLAFESLAVTPDQRFLVAGLENALATDGPEADIGVASLARILIWPLHPPAGGVPREVAYRVDPVRAPASWLPRFRRNGLADLVALSDERFLALERQYVLGAGTDVRLYGVSLAGATDVSHLDDLSRRRIRPASKQLLGDLAAVTDSAGRSAPPGNYEGMALGPRLPDGRRILVVVSDDNFDPLLQRTRFLAFAVASRVLD